MRPLLLLCACASLVLGCGGDPGKSDVDALARQLFESGVDRDEGMAVAQVAAYRLGGSGNLAAVPPLVEALRTHEDRMVRAAAAGALGRLRAVDAVPVLIDALTDDFGAVRKAAWALGMITDHSFEPPAGVGRERMVNLQRALRAWFATHEAELRKRLKQPGPSRIALLDPAPAHDKDATPESVAGLYHAKHWGVDVLLDLREDGTFERRAARKAKPGEIPPTPPGFTGDDSGLIKQASQGGTWSLDEDGVALTWTLRPGRESKSREDRSERLAPSRHGPFKTTAAWSHDSIYLFPKCRAPHFRRLSRASDETLAQLHPRLRWAGPGKVVGTWETRTKHPMGKLQLNADLTYTLTYNHGGYKGVEKGQWEWLHAERRVTMSGREHFDMDGSASQFGFGGWLFDVRDRVMIGTRPKGIELHAKDLIRDKR